MYDMEMINLKLSQIHSQIHSDILVLNLCMTMHKMYEAGLVSKEEYTKILNQEYKTITEQIEKTFKED